MRVLLVGLHRFGLEPGDRFLLDDAQGKAPLPEADVVIAYLDEFLDDVEVTARRQRDFRQAWERGATVLFLLGRRCGQGSLSAWVRSTLGVSFNMAPNIDVRPADERWSAYLNDQVAYALLGPADGSWPHDAHVLGTAADSPNAAVAVELRQARGLAYLLPLGDENNVPMNVERVLAALGRPDEYPEYLDHLDLEVESKLAQELAQLEVRARELSDALDRARTRKHILYARESQLEAAVVAFFNDELHIAARGIPGNAEDFRLIDTDDNAWCLGEVKGPSRRNLSRVDVFRLAAHRGDADLPEEFPALLVGNTFNGASTLSERARPIEPNVVSIAHSTHIMVVRTLDLAYLWRAAQTDKAVVPQFVDEVRARGGWFEVAADGLVTVHQS